MHNARRLVGQSKTFGQDIALISYEALKSTLYQLGLSQVPFVSCDVEGQLASR